MSLDPSVREFVGRLLTWEDAHAGFDTAVNAIPPAVRGTQPAGLPYSPWQLLQHLRLAQHDILEFCRNADYEELTWPDDYWPASPAPPSAGAWDEAVQAFHRDRAALQELASNPKVDLLARIPHGDGQTYLREIVLAADHAAYHVGQLVLMARLLGVWK
jgi:uncharacterized damage-inducible protein DinB